MGSFSLEISPTLIRLLTLALSISSEAALYLIFFFDEREASREATKLARQARGMINEPGVLLADMSNLTTCGS